jgi:flavin-binding protein dodecin
MPNSTYKVIEVIGSSPTSWEEAAKSVIEQTVKHLEDVRVARVVDQDVRVENGKIVAYRTKLSLSFRFHDAAELNK